MQAVSVGEVQVAQAIANALWEAGYGLNLTISSSTPQGLHLAQQSLGVKAQVMPFPLDFMWAVKSAAQRIRPRVYVSLETEIWPNLLCALYQQNTKILMLNGRISARSFPRYRKIKPLVSACLSFYSCFSMISQEDAERIAALGADPKKISVGGNAKYSYLSQRAKNADIGDIKTRLNLSGKKLVIAGSVRSGEEDAVLEGFKRVLLNEPDTIMLVAPRHVKRSANWLSAASAKGFMAARWSGFKVRPQAVNVVILDEMGRLFDFYGLSTAAFVGGSLVDKGGQNPLEPSAWGVPVAFGPFMQDFVQATELLLPHAAQQIHNTEQLASFWLNCLADKDYALNMGGQGKARVARLSEAAGNSARLILRQLDIQ